MKMRAPKTDILRALSTEEFIHQWWGPHDFECPTASIDFKVGGDYKFCMRSLDDGEEIWSEGHFLAISPDRIVMSDQPSDENSHEAGPFADLGEAFITFELKEATDGMTTVTLSHEGLPARMHDDCVEGWTESLEKLKTVVERH